LDDELTAELDAVARQLGKAKNWVVREAVREYVRKVRQSGFAADIREQSLAANAVDAEGEEVWERLHDDRGWR
jgi:predicted transcriptional regulator